MSETPTQILWREAGQPKPSKGTVEHIDGSDCHVCGRHSTEVVSAKDAIPRADTDADRFRAPWSEWVCAACLWCSEGRPPKSAGEEAGTFVSRKRAET